MVASPAQGSSDVSTVLSNLNMAGRVRCQDAQVCSPGIHRSVDPEIEEACMLK